MNILIMVLIRDKLNIPLDIVRFINEQVVYDQLNNQNIKKAVELWCKNQEECQFKFDHISHWNVKNVEDMNCMFLGAISFNGDISQWNVRLMRNMLNNARLFNRDLSNWDVSKGTNMRSMFDGASSFNQERYFPQLK